MLPDTPTHQPVAAVLASELFAIGGKVKGEGGADTNKIYKYSLISNSWVHIDHLPAPRSRTAVAVLSAREFLVIGGSCDGSVNTVYQGRL